MKLGIKEPKKASVVENKGSDFLNNKKTFAVVSLVVIALFTAGVICVVLNAQEVFQLRHEGIVADMGHYANLSLIFFALASIAVLVWMDCQDGGTIMKTGVFSIVIGFIGALLGALIGLVVNLHIVEIGSPSPVVGQTEILEEQGYSHVEVYDDKDSDYAFTAEKDGEDHILYITYDDGKMFVEQVERNTPVQVK